MIHRTKGEISFECDSCGDLLETYEDSWNVAWNMAKRDDWKSRKIFDEWKHFCPKCEE